MRSRLWWETKIGSECSREGETERRLDCRRRTSVTEVGPLRGWEGRVAEGRGLVEGPLQAAEAPQTSV